MKRSSALAAVLAVLLLGIAWLSGGRGEPTGVRELGLGVQPAEVHRPMVDERGAGSAVEPVEPVELDHERTPASARPTPAETEPSKLALEGRVLDDAGVPVRRFRVYAVREVRAGSRTRGRLLRRSIEAGRPTGPRLRSADVDDATGAFCFDDAGKWTWSVVVAADGHALSEVAVAEVPGSPVEVRLLRLAGIEGVVVDGADVPVADVVVLGRPATVLAGQEWAWRSEPTTENGRFELRDLPPEPVHLIAQSDTGAGPLVGVRLAAGEVARGVRLRFHRGGRVEGTVDSADTPVADREVMLFGVRSQRWLETRTDDAGRFAFESVDPGEFIIELRGAKTGELVPLGEKSWMEERGPDVRKRISVESGRTTRVDFGAPTESAVLVRGYVDHGDRPAADVEVSVSATAEGATDRAARTDAAGRFEVELDGPGVHRFHFRRDEQSSGQSIERDVPAGPEVELDFVLSTGRVSGRVHGVSARVPLTLQRREKAVDRSAYWRNIGYAHSDADGRFAFDFLEPGSYVLRAGDDMQANLEGVVAGPGRVVREVAVAEGGDIELDLPLEEGGVLAGGVLDGQGSPVAGVRLRVLDASGLAQSAFWESQTPSDGRFRIGRLAPGVYRVLAVDGERSAESGLVRVAAGVEASVEVRL